MSIQTVIMITHDKDSMNEIASAQVFKGLLMPSYEPRKEAIALQTFFNALASGVRMGSMQVGVNATPGVAASGSITCTGVLANDTVTIAGVTLTAVSGTPAADQFQVGGSDAATAANLAAAISADSTLSGYVSASVNSNVVSLSAATQCALGNLVTLASSNGSRLALSGANLSGGAGNNGSLTTYKYGV